MLNTSNSVQTREALPLILIRGFGGSDVVEEQKNAYQGFNEGTVYPLKQGENYIYEGLILRLMKSNWRYQDATNVVNYSNKEIAHMRENLPQELRSLDQAGFFSKSKVVIDPAMALNLINSDDDPRQTLWVFRYYDLGDRAFNQYGIALTRLIDFIRTLVDIKLKAKGIESHVNKVNIIAHSMGGLIARQAIQCAFRDNETRVGQATAEESINKIVTLGTPHQGISFQLLQELSWIPFLQADDEIEQFNPEKQADPINEVGFNKLKDHFPLDRLLNIVGTNHHTYNYTSSRILNRLFAAANDGGLSYNRSDGLVKQKYAQIPGAPRTFIHKSHGGHDSIINSREAYEISSRFLFGDIRARLRLIEANITSNKGADFLGKSEYFMGVSIKPRGVDFELFHQSREAENCYGPFSSKDFSDSPAIFDWASNNRLIWEGFLLRNHHKPDLVLRLQFYVSERDLFGIGFSDNIILLAHYFVRAVTDSNSFQLLLYNDENFSANGTPMAKTRDGWQFQVAGRNFEGTFRIELDTIPKCGIPQPIVPH
ncbi:MULTISPECIES: hypothetical protein [Trichocoleus]|uniref:GPI inositol-deacylase n=1 Tax=Trichocoleus desertorum GB2-A4 TaxID=2933944 RepID=A0ABV0JDW6_9CYAN|nr:hypothetical protein [Trichocoleus sp. FACHB-46]MBD1865167.1 hypothetical protein [Trichocoleus sp. FACHB-46]